MAQHTGGNARLLWLGLALAACSAHEPRAGQASLRQVPEIGWRIIEVLDFNGDGLGDVLWSDPDTGRIEVTLLRGTHLLELGPAIPGPEGAGWAGVSGAEFDVDGIGDVCWFSPRAKAAAVWLMNGTDVDERGRELPAPPGEGWFVAHTGDFDGDGLDDLIWHDAAHDRSLVWLMRGTCPRRLGTELPGPSGAGWVSPGTGDFNGDGMYDVLWYDTITHGIQIWLMAGDRILERGPEIPAPPGDWTAVTSADFDGDGLQDVIWNDVHANRMAVWLMEGTHVRSFGPDIPGPAGEGWSVGSAGDTDGDRRADVVWQNRRTRRQMVWTMFGTHVAARGAELPAPE